MNTAEFMQSEEFKRLRVILKVLFLHYQCIRCQKHRRMELIL